jgi:hypothetical protein
MTEAALTERLDERGLLQRARGPGVYALRVAVPDDMATVRARWDDHLDARPGDDALTRLHAADRVAYVGASTHVYERLCDHVAGDARTTAFLSVFGFERVVDIWPAAHPFPVETSKAIRLAREGWTVWCDGDVWG